MPSVFGGLRSNPIFAGMAAANAAAAAGGSSSSESDSDEEDEDDSLLEDLSDFEQFEEQMLANPGGFDAIYGRAQAEGVELDDLSDFEDFEGHDQVADPYLATAGDSTDDSSDDDDDEEDGDGLGAMAPRGAAGHGRKVSFGPRPDSMDVDAEIIVPQVQYEDVAINYNTGAGPSAVPTRSAGEETAAGSDDSEDEGNFEDESELPAESNELDLGNGSHFANVRRLWGTRLGGDNEA
jgi:hypothetical protein